MYTYQAIKDLITGKLSLSITFWGWGVCGGFFFGLVSLAGLYWKYSFLIPIALVLKFILFSMVLSGLTFILREKITFFGVIAFFIVLLQVIWGLFISTATIAALFSVLFS